MPVYEYQCEACGQKFEVRQKFSDQPLSSCRDCGGPVKKMISQGGFALKGGGWYQQGYSPTAGKCEGAASGNAGCSGCPKAANG